MAERIPDFGDYVLIEQKRYVGANETYRYKVVGNLESNVYRSVPVDTRKTTLERGDVVPVINAICCGVCENTVERFRVCDVKIDQ